MKLDFEHFKKIYVTTLDAPGDSAEYLAASAELDKYPQRLLTKLDNVDDENSEEFERVFRQFSDTKPRPQDVPKDESDLLPFAGFEGYALDAWGRPHGTGGQGRKRGPLAAIRQWKPRKGRKAQFMFGYRLCLNGERVFRSALTCAIARSNAEKLRKSAPANFAEVGSI